jgi:hypothetical protein
MRNGKQTAANANINKNFFIKHPSDFRNETLWFKTTFSLFP